MAVFIEAFVIFMIEDLVVLPNEESGGRGSEIPFDVGRICKNLIPLQINSDYAKEGLIFINRNRVGNEVLVNVRVVIRLDPNRLGGILDRIPPDDVFLIFLGEVEDVGDWGGGEVVSVYWADFENALTIDSFALGNPA